MVRLSGTEAVASVLCVAQPAALPRLLGHLKPLLLLEPMHELRTHVPAFTAQQDVQSQITKPRSCRSQFLQPLPQGFLVRTTALILQYTATRLKQPARAALADCVTALQMFSEFAPTCRL